MRNNDLLENTIAARLSNTKTDSGVVVLLTGTWGAGKTFIWRNSIATRLKDSHPVTISLFGIESIQELKRRLTNEYYLQMAKGLIKAEGEEVTIKDLAGALTEGVLKLLKAVDSKAGTNILSIDLDPTRFIKEGAIICFDDVERCAKGLSPVEIIGFANYLAEYRKARVLLIMNDEALKDSSCGISPADKAEHGATIDDLIERAVGCHVHLDIKIEEAMELFLDDGKLAPGLHVDSERLRETIRLAFAAAELTNLRTLIRVKDGLGYLKESVPDSISYEHIEQYIIFSVEKARVGTLKRENYDFVPELVLFSNTKLDRSLDARTQFLNRYYPNGPARYAFCIWMFDFVEKGIFDASAYLNSVRPGETRVSSEVELLIGTVVQDGGFTWDDSEVAKWLSDVQTLFESSEPLSTSQIMYLISYFELLSNRIGTSLPNGLLDKIAQRLDVNASRGDKSFDSVERMRLDSFDGSWKMLNSNYVKKQGEVALANTREIVIEAISTADTERFSQILADEPENSIDVALSDVGRAAILRSLAVNRKSLFKMLFELHSLISRMPDRRSAAEPSRVALFKKVLAELKGDSACEKMDSVRLDYLISQC